MSKLKSATIPVSQTLQNALRAEAKFEKVWQSLSTAEKNVYMKVNGFHETTPYAIDQFQGIPRIKEIEDPVINEEPVEEDFPESFNPNEMQSIIDILTNEPLINPLSEMSFMNSIKPKLTKVGDVVKSAPNIVKKHVHNISENAKKSAAEWSAKSPTEKLHHAVKHVGKAVGNVLHHGAHYAKHEVNMYHGASKAVAHLATGKKWKDLHPEHKKNLKHALIHAGITAGSMALGDATGHSGHILANFAAEHAHHAALFGAGQVGFKSGKDAYKKATSTVEPHLTNLELKKESKKIIQALIDADIPEDEWAEILHEIEQETKKDNKLGHKV